MTKRFRIGLALATALAMAATTGCGKKVDDKEKNEPAKPGEKAAAPAKTVGVDMDKKILYVGTLDAMSGPAAVIGKPFAMGKRLLARVVNAGGSGLLPEGWKLELIEKDHGYNPQKSVQEYEGLKDKVLFIGTCFGTKNTLPLIDHLKRDNVVVFPASLSSAMAEHEHTVPLGPSYKVEAMRGMDWAVEHAGGADKVKAAIVYQKDDYGDDGLAGWKAAAKFHGVEIVAEATVAPTDEDVSGVIKVLEDAGANYVLLTVLPKQTGQLLGTALAMKYTPNWLGNTPSWLDGFFEMLKDKKVLFDNFYWIAGLPYWGEKVPHMDEFLANWEKHKEGLGNPDFYVIASYIQGMIQLEAFSRALKAGDVSRAGYMKALRGLKEWDADGMIQPVNLETFPYQTSTRTHVLKPIFDSKSWEEVAPYAEPKALGGGGEK